MLTNNYIYLIILFIIPIVFKWIFWLFILQLKEYRRDRFQEYLSTKQWKKAIFNFWIIPEFLILLIWLLFQIWILKQILAYYPLIFLLSLEGIYVIYKILKNQTFKPDKTIRILIVSTFFLLWIILTLFLIYTNLNLIYIIFPLFLIILPFYVIFCNLITSPIINIQKRKIFKQAWNKTKNLKLKKIWITWSFWKTTTKEYLSHLLSTKYKLFKTNKNINTELWLANTILKKLSDKYDYFIAEMWAYKKWEIRQSWKITNHEDWFLTWIWNQHVALFKNIQNIIYWKSEIWEKILENWWKLYLTDKVEIKNDEFIVNKKTYKTPETIKKLIKNNQLIQYWINHKQANSEILEYNENWTKFIFNYKQNNLYLQTNLIWKAQIENLTWVIAYSIDQNIEIKKIKSKIQNMPQPDHTLSIIKKNKNLIQIDDTYNLSVNGLFNGIDVIKFFNWKKILVMDDILELWQDSEKIHYEIWTEIWHYFDKIMFVWINYKKSFLKGIKKVNCDWKIINKIESTNHEKTIILYEWKKASKFLII